MALVVQGDKANNKISSCAVFLKRVEIGALQVDCVNGIREQIGQLLQNGPDVSSQWNCPLNKCGFGEVFSKNFSATAKEMRFLRIQK